ncbi:MAG: AmmeMemoRadiSam system radical SAM enzyme [Bacteroidetes bacterium]|nr:AmmeMemoRadiSam system radical SAM enzyme [Bacteroidota bacterium]
MYPATHYKNTLGRQVQCTLCPHNCNLLPGETGKCKTRTNRGSKLYSITYGILSAISTDPVEKKPLYHFKPGSSILSIGSLGCNLTCDFCQNCNISQPDPDQFSRYPYRDPADIVQKTLLHRDSIGLAYTYNEPTVYYEYMVECAIRIHEEGLVNVMVTNGFINTEPLNGLLNYMDAFNIDLKSFRNDFYRKRSSARLRPILDAIATVAASETHMELTFLIIPGYNDSPLEWREMIRWIEENCGADTILHVSKYFPRYNLQSIPTPTWLMEKFIDAARERIQYVYPGNNPHFDNNTYCPDCRSILIEREVYKTKVSGLTEMGSCSQCQMKIKGIFNAT